MINKEEICTHIIINFERGRENLNNCLRHNFTKNNNGRFIKAELLRSRWGEGNIKVYS